MFALALVIGRSGRRSRVLSSNVTTVTQPPATSKPPSHLLQNQILHFQKLNHTLIITITVYHLTVNTDSAQQPSNLQRNILSWKRTSYLHCRKTPRSAHTCHRPGDVQYIIRPSKHARHQERLHCHRPRLREHANHYAADATACECTHIRAAARRGSRCDHHLHFAEHDHPDHRRRHRSARQLPVRSGKRLCPRSCCQQRREHH